MFPSHRQAREWATGLGWFSLALGAAELLLAPRIARASGLPRADAGLVRAYGVREIATGAGLLAARRAGVSPAPWLWARVAGDVLDMATLARGLEHPRRSGQRGAMLALAAVAGVTLLDLLAARSLSTPPARAKADYRQRSGFASSPAQMRGVAADQAQARFAKGGDSPAAPAAPAVAAADISTPA